MNHRPSEASPSPGVHSENIRRQLTELIEHLEADMGRVDDTGFRGLLEKSAEVLKGLRTLFERFEPAGEPTEGQGKQPRREPSKTKEPRDAAPSTKGNSMDAGRDPSKAGPARPAKAATKPSSKGMVSAKAAGSSPASRAKASRPAAAPAKGNKATRQKNTGSTSGKPGDVPVQPKPAPAMMLPKSAPKPMPPQSGKPIWAKPHSS